MSGRSTPEVIIIVFAPCIVKVFKELRPTHRSLHLAMAAYIEREYG
jgi:hypothetical protein